MKKKIYILIYLFSSILFSQNLAQQNQSFKNYNVFNPSFYTIDASLRTIATDIEALNVDDSVLLDIQNDKPEFISFQLVHGSNTLLVKMQRQEILANDYKIRNQNDEVLEYTPGLYYRGIVNNDHESLVVFNFFKHSVNAVISIPGYGNRNVGQLENSNQYVIYTDSKMSETQDFRCQVDDIEQGADLLPQNQVQSRSPSAINCIRVFYEITNDIYNQNSESVSDTMNWLTSVHNIVATLYSDVSISTALSDVLIWQEVDPYYGINLNKLESFKYNRIIFDGDLGHLLDLPSTGGVAYINSLCGSFRYAYSGVAMSFEQLPTYSWTVNVISHEMGHSLGSPHTHACFWNGNNTAIDSCGPNNGFSEGCDNGPIPTNGTIMSYCHLDATGINLANGFHPQVSAYMNNNIDTKPCLGTDCIDSCLQTIAGVTVSQLDINSLAINIDDVVASSWDYTIFELTLFSNPDPLTTTNNNSFIYNNIQPNTYYVVQVRNNCLNGSHDSFFNVIYLTDDDWCSNRVFTRYDALDSNYQESQSFEKTFYPDASGKITLNINDFNLEENVDFMTIYDGETTNAPVFTDGNNLSGSSLSTTFFEATNDVGAITVKFSSNLSVNSVWDIAVSCTTLSNEQFLENYFSIFPNPLNSELNLKSLTPLDDMIIYDLHGRIVFQKTLSEQLNTKVDLSQLNSGVYLMRVNKGKSSAIKRIIKK